MIILNLKRVSLPKSFLTRPVAHRGLHSASVCENSLTAFRLAAEKNYGIELDIHLTKDGKLAVVHDSDLFRVTGKEGIIEHLSSEELKDYTLLPDREPVPLLDDVLALIQGRVPILIELKFDDGFDHHQADALLKLLASYPHKDMIALQSFHPLAVNHLKRHTNTYSVGYLSSFKLKNLSIPALYLLKSLKLYRLIHADFISYDINYLPNKYAGRLQKKGETVLAWTIDSKEKLERAKTAADNIIFESIVPEENST
ncbi:MAG TPA: glycerophosphodiester phosphodiesterase family protein [Methanocorpusculum sp.]|nr:glycerophosphodiester phosphodiesterase family protein [Methanocorpusculum sp.]HJJ39583.1 glycerophosphodiester phosphodiesterase family protein [Methanocorpusculum sp.]